MTGDDPSKIPDFPAALAAAERHANGTALVASPSPLQADEPGWFAGLKANFLAHLIATANHLPQTRVLRRADPEFASEAYRPLRTAILSKRLSRQA
jgi:hypothetical protein